MVIELLGQLREGDRRDWGRGGADQPIGDDREDERRPYGSEDGPGSRSAGTALAREAGEEQGTRASPAIGGRAALSRFISGRGGHESVCQEESGQRTPWCP